MVVHGAFASPAGWDRVADALHKDGYQTATPGPAGASALSAAFGAAAAASPQKMEIVQARCQSDHRATEGRLGAGQRTSLR